jgi:hypothetical protein
MKPTKRHPDPLGRSRTLNGYRRYALCLAIAITGSAWPIQARSIEAIFDSHSETRASRQLTAEPPPPNQVDGNSIRRARSHSPLP